MAGGAGDVRHLCSRSTAAATMLASLSGMQSVQDPIVEGAAATASSDAVLEAWLAAQGARLSTCLLDEGGVSCACKMDILCPWVVAVSAQQSFQRTWAIPARETGCCYASLADGTTLNTCSGVSCHATIGKEA